MLSSPLDGRLTHGSIPFFFVNCPGALGLIRIGQKAKTVLIQYMIGRGTMDDFIIPLIHRKQWTLKSTVGERATF